MNTEGGIKNKHRTFKAGGKIGSCVGSRGTNLLASNSTEGPCNQHHTGLYSNADQVIFS